MGSDVDTGERTVLDIRAGQQSFRRKCSAAYRKDETDRGEHDNCRGDQKDARRRRTLAAFRPDWRRRGPGCAALPLALLPAGHLQPR